MSGGQKGALSHQRAAAPAEASITARERKRQRERIFSDRLGGKRRTRHLLQETVRLATQPMANLGGALSSRGLARKPVSLNCPPCSPTCLDRAILQCRGLTVSYTQIFNCPVVCAPSPCVVPGSAAAQRSRPRSASWCPHASLILSGVMRVRFCAPPPPRKRSGDLRLQSPISLFSFPSSHVFRQRVCLKLSWVHRH